MAVVICSRCNGEGTIRESLPYGDCEIVKCETCKGSGKMYERSFYLQIPFDDRNSREYYDTDSLIINQIRELQLKLKNKV